MLKTIDQTKATIKGIVVKVVKGIGIAKMKMMSKSYYFRLSSEHKWRYS